MSKMRHDHIADTQWELISACLQQVDNTFDMPLSVAPPCITGHLPLDLVLFPSIFNLLSWRLISHTQEIIHPLA